MSVTTPATDPAVDLDNATRRFAKATAAYMVGLEAAVGSLSTLTTGIHGFDYAVTVSHADKPHILPLLADLTFDIESAFGVTIKTLVMAGAVAKKNAGTRDLGAGEVRIKKASIRFAGGSVVKTSPGTAVIRYDILSARRELT